MMVQSGWAGLALCLSLGALGCSDDEGGQQGAPGGSAGSPATSGGSVGNVGGGAGQTAVAGGGAGAPAAGAQGNGGTAATPVDGIWPTYPEAAAAPLSTKTLIVLLDFADTDADARVPNAEAAWSQMIFGTEQGQGNHYWYQTSGGRFQLLRAKETQGTLDDGLVRVKVSANKPLTSVVTESEPWLTEALDTLRASVDFKAFDKNGDGLLTNDELSVLFILDVAANVLAFADAQANIELGYAIPGTGVTLDKFARSLAMISSIGVPMHELAHHIFSLDHFTSPNDHDLMGMGSYAEDPTIGNLHNPTYHAGTRPTGLHGFNAQRVGFASVTKLTDTARGVKLYSPELGQRRNVIELPVMDGLIYVENRTRWGYDASIPFCEGSDGGLFVTEISQYLGAVNVPGIKRNLVATEFFEGELDFCEYYSHAGHNDAFEFGGWRFENISQAGTTMTVDIVKVAATPAIDHYKVGYWVNDTTRVGYRRKLFKRFDATAKPVMNFSEIIDGYTTATRIPVFLNAYYTTGEVRAHNHLAAWTSDSPYVTIVTDGQPFTNEGALMPSAISVIQYDPGATPTATATITVNTGTNAGAFGLSNVPAP